VSWHSESALRRSLKGNQSGPSLPCGLLLTLLPFLVLGQGRVKQVPPAPTPAPPVEQADPSGRQALWTEQLGAAEKKWAASGVVSYNFTLRVQCFCVGDLLEPHVIRVAQGVATPLTDRSPCTRERLTRIIHQPENCVPNRPARVSGVRVRTRTRLSVPGSGGSRGVKPRIEADVPTAPL
jgi:hypothetical protein